VAFVFNNIPKVTAIISFYIIDMQVLTDKNMLIIIHKFKTNIIPMFPEREEHLEQENLALVE